MKVAYFVSRYPIDSGFILTGAGALLDEGHEVDLYALDGAAPPGRTPHDVIRTHRLDERASVVLRPSRWIAAAAGAPRALAAARQAVGARAIQALNPVHHGVRAASWAPLYEAAAFRRGGRYDILHCQFATLAPPVLRHQRSGALCGRVVAHFRGFDITKEADARPEYIREVLSGADWFIANSEHFRRRALSLGCDPERLSVVPSGVDPDAFPYRERFGPSGPVLKLLGVGRIVDKKGFPFSVRAVARLVREGVPAHLRIVGEGAARPRLEREIAELGMGDHVTLVGAVSNREVAQELDAADVVLSTNVTAANGDQDATVNTAKEAVCAGAPVVAFLHGGIPELIEDGVTGLLAPEGDVEAVVAAIKRLIAEPSLFSTLPRRGRERVIERYSIEASKRAQLEVYDRVMSS